MDLVRDVLDTQVLDRDKHHAGRVDGIVLQIHDAEQPRVVYLELGGATLARRLGRVGCWFAIRLARLAHAAHGSEHEVFRLSWDYVRQIEYDTVVADIDGETSRASAWERWLADHVISRIPGA